MTWLVGVINSRISSLGNSRSGNHMKTSLANWYDHLEYLSSKVLKFLVFQYNLPINNSLFFFFNSCLCNKSHQLPFGISTLKSRGPLDLLHTNVWGLSLVVPMNGFSYNFIFVDYFIKYTWLFPKSKKLIRRVSHFLKVQNYDGKIFQNSITTIYFDGEGESHGIQHLFSPQHTPQYVASPKHQHRHVETRLTLLHKASLLFSFWSHAFQVVVYLINQISTPILYKSPFELLYQTTLNYSKL